MVAREDFHAGLSAVPPAAGYCGSPLRPDVPDRLAEAEHAGSDHIFGIFETNGWHSGAALALGVVSLYFTMRPRRARDAALAIGVLHVGIVAALIALPPETFWLASNAADQVVHSTTAIAGIGSALLTQASETAREL